MRPGRGEPPERAGADTLGAYMRSLHGVVSARTAARRLSSLRGFCRFLLQDGVRDDDPSLLLDSPRLPRSLPRNLTEGEVDALMDAAAACPEPTALAALELLYATGLRVSELLALTQAALRAEAGTLIVRGKGGRERMVLVSTPARTAARALMAHTGPGRWLFPGRDPRQPLTRQGFGLMLKQVALVAGLDPAPREPARAAPQLRQPHAGPRRRPSQPADAAGPRRHRHHADLYPRAGGAAAGDRGAAPPTVKRRSHALSPAPCATSWTSKKPVAELEIKIAELRAMADAPDGLNIDDEVRLLEDKADKQLRLTFAKLSPWQKAQVARHPERPHAQDYIDGLLTDYVPLAGDRAFAEDHAVVGGMGRFRGQAVVVLGTERGADTESRVRHNFGMARPEGYRKARRLIELAGRFGLPLLTFVDTAGAFPGIDAEARGQAEAIARSIDACLVAPGAGHRHHHRRRRLRRRDRAGSRGPCVDAGTRGLFRDLPRRLRQHPVAGRRAGEHGGGGAQVDRGGSAGGGDRGSGGAGTAGRRAPGRGGDDRGGGGGGAGGDVAVVGGGRGGAADAAAG